MKKLNAILLVILSVSTIFFSTCSDDPQKKGPKETAEAFLTALQHGDYEKAKTYCTPGTQSNLSMFETFSGMGANPFGGDFEILREEESGDYATVYYSTEDEKEKLVRLRKEGKEWQVIANKGDFSGDSDNDGPDLDLDLDEPEEEDPADTYRLKREGRTAEQTGKDFLSALMFNDFDKAKIYASKSTAEMLDFQESMSKLGDDDGGIDEFEVIKTEEDDDIARLYYKEKGEDKEKVLKMTKDKHGNWEVVMTKSDMEDDEE